MGKEINIILGLAPMFIVFFLGVFLTYYKIKNHVNIIPKNREEFFGVLFFFMSLLCLAFLSLFYLYIIASTYNWPSVFQGVGQTPENWKNEMA